ncbi:flagellar brake protein [Camelliibacillus cellulosilyticus]|uniref:Flagellar brake protein n=1 Tax=Camelliibacillus cellulosilyticus TaxID=2174486 RepID=A0ABV9GI90_9BACL
MIKVGDTLYLEAYVNGKRDTYKTSVVEISGEDLLTEVPIHEKTKKLKSFPVDTAFLASFITNGTVRRFKTKLRRVLNENVPVYVFSYPNNETFVTVQRRAHMRVAAALDVAVHPIHNEFSPFTSVTVDLSAGGCSIILNREIDGLQEGMEVKMWAALPLSRDRYHYLKIICRVIRFDLQEGRRLLSMQFVDLNDASRVQIVRYCFKRELFLANQ